MSSAPKLEDQILDIMAQVAPVAREDIKLDHDLRVDLRMDSVSSMELVCMLCEEFDIDVEIEEAMEVRDVRGAIEMTKRHISSAA